jgi:hypothetical protein
MLAVFGSPYTLPNHLKPHLQQNRNNRYAWQEADSGIIAFVGSFGD